MTETTRREINNFLEKTGYLPMVSDEEVFVDTFFTKKENYSSCDFLNMAFQVVYRRTKSNLVERVNSREFALLGEQLNCIINEPILSGTENRQRFLMGIDV